LDKNVNLYNIDAAATHWINSFATASWLLDQALIGMSIVGVPLMVLGVAIQWWTWIDRMSRRHVLLSAGFSFLLGLAINQVILLLVHRMRPYDAGITQLFVAPSSDPSFPSDHATASFAIAATFLVTRFRGAWVFLIAAILISLSRIFIGTHYVSDVMGGWITAIVAVSLVQLLYREGSQVDAFLTSIL
jgi:undecaprenyl-diphosphatase